MYLTKLLLCLAVLGVSDALIEFAKSRIYDEKDFLNTRSVVVKEYCADGCNVYISIPDASADIAKWIYIFTVANSKEKDGRKRPFATKGDQVFFENDNDRLKSAPLLIWVVQKDAPYYDNVEIYDAADLDRASAPAQLITVMSTEPFVVTTKTIGPMTMSAFTAGFDALDSADKCERVVLQENHITYQDLQVSVRSPLFTLSYDKFAYQDSEIALRASQDDVAVFDLTKPMFATSPGYIGCSVKEGISQYGNIYAKTFRSSLYDDKTKFKFTSNYPVSLVLSGDVATDADHPVTVVADGIVVWTATEAVEETAVDAVAKELIVKWTRNSADLDQYFMIRVEQDDYSMPDFTTDDPIDTTTEIPTDEDCEGFNEGVCYLIGANVKSWQDAQDVCRNLRAVPASIHDQQANSFIRRLAVSKGKVNGLLLGATMSGKGNDFGWVDGSKWNYENFYPEFPLSWAGECLAMDTTATTGQWMNVACSDNLPVVCERKCE